MNITPIAEYYNPDRWEQTMTLNRIQENNNTYYSIRSMSHGKDYKTLRGAKAALTRNGFTFVKSYEEE